MSRQRVNVAIAAGLHRQPFLMPRYRFETAPVYEPGFALFSALLLRRHRACSVFENGPDALHNAGAVRWLAVHPCSASKKSAA
ncbi:hypothetical protein [Bradyrhizobium sp. 18]|uniref:hypothetical protein n=1 Tax=Bradyrhizobium sp. 18 TaxID=2782657 RepID=UPI001FFA8E52|nr:hypothetical protein [Bradyrhizobium sp. 18]